jgi:hypothetical protein
MRIGAGIALTAGLLGIAGCGRSGPATYPVHGQIRTAPGGLEALVGSHVEAARVDDERIRSSGIIQPDGSFDLEMHQAGAVLCGAEAGKYKVRIIPADENRTDRRRVLDAIGSRVLTFKTTPFVIDVPSDAVTIDVSKR